MGEEDTADDDQGGERGDGDISVRSGSSATSMPVCTAGRTTTSHSERNRDMSGLTAGSSGSNATPSTSTYE